MASGNYPENPASGYFAGGHKCVELQTGTFRVNDLFLEGLFGQSGLFLEDGISFIVHCENDRASKGYIGLFDVLVHSFGNDLCP
jgi:hypothetical protein